MSSTGLLKRGFLLSIMAGVGMLSVISCATQKDSANTAEQTAEPVVAAEAVYADLLSGASSVYDVSQSLNGTAEQFPEAVDAESGNGEEEIVIPVIEPKKVEPRKAYLEPTVRVQLLGNASSISVGSDAEMTLEFGSNSMRVEPGSQIQFKPRSARVSARSYAVGIATYEGDEYEDAKQFAEGWKKRGYTVRLIKAGGPLVQADGTIADTTVYWVALGMFKDKQAAERFRDKLYSWGISCWVIDESVVSPRGNIELLNAAGKPQAYANSRVTISSSAPIEIRNVPFGHGFWDSGNREHRTYLSPIEVIVDKKGKLAAVNELKLEEYVEGIVPVEIRLSAPDEALKAQAVSARTEAVAKLGIQHVFDPYDFCASQHCQEFGGLTRRTKRTDAAVNATRGQVLMFDGVLVDAVYSANCGGHTEHNENVWSSRVNKALRGVSELYSNPESFASPLPSWQLSNWLKSTPSAYCGDPRVGERRNFRWTVRHGAAELSRIVNKHRRVGDIRDIKVRARGVSGRAKQMTIVGSRDIAVINKELPIRRVLGGLKSSMFIVEIARDSAGNPTSFVFHGGGWGHGVGMCQAGAEGMALRGFTYTDILKHYFTGTEIKQLYE